MIRSSFPISLKIPAIAVLVFSLSGCSGLTLDAKQQDRNACRYISQLLEGKALQITADTGSLNAVADALEKNALPQASMHFAGQIQQVIDAARKSSRASIFAKTAGLIQLNSYSQKVIAHCVNLEMH